MFGIKLPCCNRSNLSKWSFFAESYFKKGAEESSERPVSNDDRTTSWSGYHRSSVIEPKALWQRAGEVGCKLLMDLSDTFSCIGRRRYLSSGSWGLKVRNLEIETQNLIQARDRGYELPNRWTTCSGFLLIRSMNNVPYCSNSSNFGPKKWR